MSEGTFKCTKFPSSGHRRKNNKIKQQFTIGNFTILPFDIKHDVNEPLGFLINHPDWAYSFMTDTVYSKYSSTKYIVEVNYESDIINAKFGSNSKF
jgi:phosphoribosyl 1,2-cyclic phosphodiesterase